MKPVKFIVLASTLVSILGVLAFDWISVTGSLPKLLSDLPRTGMDNGGAIFLFFLAMPLIGAGIGAAKRFGRGLALLSMFGSFVASFFSLVKYSDIDQAARTAKSLGVTLGVGMGYWIFFAGASVAFLASLVALIKPEPKPAVAPQAPQGFGPAYSPR